jgi:hypothetical protein
MPSTAEDDITFLMSDSSYCFGSLRNGLVSFNDFLRMVNFNIRKVTFET